MYILVDLNLRDIEFEEADDTKRFHVSVAHGDDVRAVGEILSAKEVGYVEVAGDEENAWISIDAVTEMARGRTKPGWENHFEKMIEGARKHGWVSHDGTHLKAHLDWIDVDGV
ncbi:MAG: hypothetical protein HYX32_04345 [Actinobacteria bacterium]|nr:hypothetical protein [Actinomycetota bacterium]